MRNGSLLVELSGLYNNTEFVLFQHLAHMFGVYYTRIQTTTLIKHQQRVNASILPDEMTEVVNSIKNYFTVKPFLFNTKYY